MDTSKGITIEIETADKQEQQKVLEYLKDKGYKAEPWMEIPKWDKRPLLMFPMQFPEGIEYR